VHVSGGREWLCMYKITMIEPAVGSSLRRWVTRRGTHSVSETIRLPGGRFEYSRSGRGEGRIYTNLASSQGERNRQRAKSPCRGACRGRLDSRGDIKKYKTSFLLLSNKRGQSTSVLGNSTLTIGRNTNLKYVTPTVRAARRFEDQPGSEYAS